MSWEDLATGYLLAADVISAYQKIHQLGLMRIQIDFKNATAYNHDNATQPYDEKNAYFNGTNWYGYYLATQNATGFSKMYYWSILHKIHEEEKATNKLVNKGMVCGNLGVSSLAEGDIDGGIAYLLWAMEEDRFWTRDPERSIFKNTLYEQYAKGGSRAGLSQFGMLAPWAQVDVIIKNYDIAFPTEKINYANFLIELETSIEHRSLFEGAIWIIHRNLAILKQERDLGIFTSKNNLYTRLRLLDGLIGLCRFIELRMKSRNAGLEGPLGVVLSSVFATEPWLLSIREICSLKNSPKTPEEFDVCIKFGLEKLSGHGRSIYILWVLRNYSSHVCDPATPYVFENFEKILEEIVFAYLYYLKKNNLV